MNNNNPNARNGLSRSDIEYKKFFKDQFGMPAIRVGADDIDTVTALVYVQAADISADYMAGSVGQVKTITEYQAGALTGAPTKVTTLTYTDPVYTTKPTGIVVVQGTL